MRILQSSNLTTGCYLEYTLSSSAFNVHEYTKMKTKKESSKMEPRIPPSKKGYHLDNHLQYMARLMK